MLKKKNPLQRKKKLKPSEAQPRSNVLMLSAGAGKAVGGAEGVCVGLMVSWAECKHGGLGRNWRALGHGES